jgi:hypothetical protein
LQTLDITKKLAEIDSEIADIDRRWNNERRDNKIEKSGIRLYGSNSTASATATADKSEDNTVNKNWEERRCWLKSLTQYLILN